MSTSREQLRATPPSVPSFEALQPEPKRLARTIRFSEEDEAEIDRIDEYLRARGLKRTDAAKIIRLALRVAFKHTSDDQLRQYHQDLLTRFARGKIRQAAG